MCGNRQSLNTMKMSYINNIAQTETKICYLRTCFIFFQNGIVNNRPLYKKIENNNVFLAFTNVSYYPAPWTMWGGPKSSIGSHVGNIKLGPKGLLCPEFYKVYNILLQFTSCSSSISDQTIYLNLAQSPNLSANKVPQGAFNITCGALFKEWPYIR